MQGRTYNCLRGTEGILTAFDVLQVLAVDPNKKRILLTAKKTLVESDLPIITSMADAETGMVTHGVVCKVLPKSILVELFNNVRVIVPGNEARYNWYDLSPYNFRSCRFQ